MRLHRSPVYCRRCGFSLVEVAIALAVIGFALISILGMLPIGLANFRQAMNNTVESQIVQTISNELQLTSFANFSNTTRYFDAEGNSLSSSVGAVYTANISFSSVQGSSYPLDLVATTGATTTATADCVTIQLINNTQAADRLPGSPTSQPHLTHTYSLIIANENN